MGIIDSIKNFFKPPEQKPQSSLQNTPVSSSPISSSTVTTQPAKSSGSGGGSGTITTQPAQNVGGVVVTDLTTGESVKTTTTPSGSTNREYRPRPSGSGGGGGGQLGSAGAIQAVENESLLVSSSAIAQNKAGELKASTISQSALIASDASNSGFEFPQRYKRPVGSAFVESAKNIFNFGIIGQQGFNAYGKQIFLTPFEYSANPNKPLTYNINPSFRGTEITNKDFVPEQYKSTKGMTEFDYQKSQTRIVYTSLGLDFKGEPANLASLRLSEQITSDLGKTYTAQLTQSNQQLQAYYQGKVNTGELSLTDAQAQYETALDFETKNLNTQYNYQANELYNKRVSSSNLSYNVARIEEFKAKAFEPPAYKYIKGAGKAIEVGGLIGATILGGSGVTLAVAGYTGIKTFQAGVQYAGDFSQLTTGQKIIGGASLALGAYATIATANLGVSKFYSEWRGAIYSDLYSQPAKVSGRVIETNSEFTRYATLSERQIGTSQSSTIQNTQIFQTGESRVGIVAKGKTYTSIFNPETEKFLLSTEKFTVTGNIPKTDLSPVFRSRGLGVSYEGTVGGTGNALYFKEGALSPIKYSFNAVSKDAGDFYAVAGGQSVKRIPFNKIENGLVTSQTTSRVDFYGKIYKPIQTDTVVYSSSIGAKSSPEYLASLYKTVTYKQIGASASTATTVRSQDIVLSGLAGQQISRQASSSAVYSEGAYQALSQQTIAKTITEQRSLIPVLTTKTSQLSQRQNLVVVPIDTTTTSAQQGQLTIPNVAQTQPQLNKPRPNILIPAIPSIPLLTGGGGGGGFPFIKLNLGDLGLSSNIVKGGKKRVGYTPSFSALIYQIKGTYKPTSLAKSGLDFRPVTKAFKIKKGKFGF